MKTFLNYALVSLVLAAPLVLTPKSYAVFGVGDTTIVVGDTTDIWKWPRELAQWTSLINNTTQQINQTERLLDLVGKPQELVREAVGSVADVTQPTQAALALKKGREAANLGRALYGLNNTAERVINRANRVNGSYSAFGQTFERDRSRYEQFAAQEAMYERYLEASENERKVAEAELKVQSESMQKLAGAKTQTEIDLFNAKIAASKQRQDLAHQVSVRAKGELDATRGQLVVEAERKQEADREWNQTLVTQMRAKALAAYNAQTNGAPN